MRFPLVGVRSRFRQLFGRPDPDLDVNPREIDWQSPEGRRVLGRQHWDERLWWPRRPERWWPDR